MGSRLARIEAGFTGRDIIAFHSNRSSGRRSTRAKAPLNSKTFLTISPLDIPAAGAKWWLGLASVRSLVEFDHVAF